MVDLPRFLELVSQNPVAANPEVFERVEDYRVPLVDESTNTFRFPGFGALPQHLDPTGGVQVPPGGSGNPPPAGGGDPPPTTPPPTTPPPAGRDPTAQLKGMPVQPSGAGESMSDIMHERATGLGYGADTYGVGWDVNMGIPEWEGDFWSWLGTVIGPFTSVLTGGGTLPLQVALGYALGYNRPIGILEAITGPMAQWLGLTEADTQKIVQGIEQAAHAEGMNPPGTYDPNAPKGPGNYATGQYATPDPAAAAAKAAGSAAAQAGTGPVSTYDPTQPKSDTNLNTGQYVAPATEPKVSDPNPPAPGTSTGTPTVDPKTGQPYDSSGNVQGGTQTGGDTSGKVVSPQYGGGIDYGDPSSGYGAKESGSGGGYYDDKGVYSDKGYSDSGYGDKGYDDKGSYDSYSDKDSGKY